GQPVEPVGPEVLVVDQGVESLANRADVAAGIVLRKIFLSRPHGVAIADRPLLVAGIAAVGRHVDRDARARPLGHQSGKVGPVERAHHFSSRVGATPCRVRARLTLSNSSGWRSSSLTAGSIRRSSQSPKRSPWGRSSYVS